MGWRTGAVSDWDTEFIQRADSAVYVDDSSASGSGTVNWAGAIGSTGWSCADITTHPDVAAPGSMWQADTFLPKGTDAA